MAEFQLLVCDVALAGDIRNVVHRGVDDPVTYPERLVLEFLHGPSTVTDIREVGFVERDEAEERNRLARIYGAKTIQQLFPGVASALPAQDKRVASIDVSPRGVENTDDAKKSARRTARKRAEDVAATAGSGRSEDDLGAIDQSAEL